VGVNMCFHRHGEVKVQRVDDFKVSLPGGKNRINEDSLARFFAGDQIGVGARNLLKELTKNHSHECTFIPAGFVTTRLSFHAAEASASEDRRSTDRWPLLQF